MGTPVITVWAGWSAHVAFWTLPQVSFGAGLSTPFVAVLDVALEFIVFKSDIRLT